MSRAKSGPATKRVHFLRDDKYLRVECGKLHNQLNQDAYYSLLTTLNPLNVTCEPCQRSMKRFLGLAYKPERIYRKGKRVTRWKVFTYTDFGQPGRKEPIGKHKSIASAMRQYARIWEIYGRQHKGYKVWQEMNQE